MKKRPRQPNNGAFLRSLDFLPPFTVVQSRCWRACTEISGMDFFVLCDAAHYVGGAVTPVGPSRHLAMAFDDA